MRHKDLAARIVLPTPRRRPAVTPIVRLGLALEQAHRRAIPAIGLRLLITAGAPIRRPRTIRIGPIPTATALTTRLRMATAATPRLVLTLRPARTLLLVLTPHLITLAVVATAAAVEAAASMAAVVVALTAAVVADPTAAVGITKIKS